MTSPIASRSPRIPRLFRWTWVLEIATVVLIGVIVIVGLTTIGTTGVAHASSNLANEPVGGYVALGVAVAGLLLAWRRPWPGMVVVASAPLVSVLLGWDPIVAWNIATFTTFWLTLRCLPGLPVGVLVAVINFASVTLAQGSFHLDAPTPAIAGMAAIIAAATGSSIRGNRRYWMELDARARDAVATREAEAERRVAQERVRIARDLHDVVGHEVALISMHLGAAEVHLSPDAHAARTDLDAVRIGVQSVLAGTQQILKVLRAGHDDDQTSPAAGYEHIGELVEAARRAGLDVAATISKPSHPLSRPVSVAAFRIVQEALTNAQRHGTGAVSLRIGVDDDAVSIEVVNVRRPAPSASTRSGYGLVGMRERASSVGGWIDVRLDENLFWLWAHLPVDRRDDS